MKHYPLFRKENIPAYFSIMIAWAIVSVVSAVTLVILTGSLSMVVALVWAAATTMSGMVIMFAASAINLRKLAPGFRRLARGEGDPQIPPVWCPVLTAATNAAVELTSQMREQDTNRDHTFQQRPMPLAENSRG